MDYPDLYFHPDWGRAHETVEKGVSVPFLHRSELGTVSHTFIKRPIDRLPDDEERYFDLVSPYGYGGPIVLECSSGDRRALIDAFMLDLASYCRDNRIVSEFIRFHPIESNHEDLGAYYEISKIKKTLATNLVDYGDPCVAEFSKTCQKTVARCRSLGMEFSIGSDRASLEPFLRIYASTMKRNMALEYYYFDQSYFEGLLRLFPGHCFIATVSHEGRPIAGGLYLHYGRYVHAHLSGTLEDSVHLSPAYLLKAELVRWARERGYRYVHYGGGYTNSEADGLFLFKKRFSRNTEFDFHVGKRIWDPSAYEKLTRAHRSSREGDSAFFPAYRHRC
jgi:serine/alanine adding enzyme